MNCEMHQSIWEKNIFTTSLIELFLWQVSDSFNFLYFSVWTEKDSVLFQTEHKYISERSHAGPSVTAAIMIHIKSQYYKSHSSP